MHEKCGVFGVYAPELREAEVARLVHTGLWTLQHRGQESTGISVGNGSAIRTHKAQGLVAHAYDEATLRNLVGPVAIGHNRYSTSGGDGLRHAQPITSGTGRLALAHNGNLPNTTTLLRKVVQAGIDATGANDSELMHAALEHRMATGASLEAAVRECFPLFTGAFSLLLLTPDTLAAARDVRGIRPLALGRIGTGYVVASETCAIDAVGGVFVRDVRPGELILIDRDGLRSVQVAPGREQLDIFEFVYFARPDSILMGQRVNEVRRRFGSQLAREHLVQADVVIPVPDSGTPAALGYAREAGIPLDLGFVKNRYIHRTFIQPAQQLRERGVQMKLNPIAEVLTGQRVAVVDDSLVRGTTARKIVGMLRQAGAREVHYLVSSPPVRFPDIYGIDLPDAADLVASRLSVEQIQQSIGADSLAYLSYDGMIAATGLPLEQLSTSCFNGVYPLEFQNAA
ncbi:MAG TPA: amidophosphoribosyltransferase [Gemmatimonadaceae bacterium]|jgi:amidophosphoribosyltransferase|nr:amidophosphoribosyltransferase [Gemmatimonadaceae bacterium]